MLPKAKFISPVVIIALVVGWVLLLLPSVTSPANSGLYLSRIVGLGQGSEARFGILDFDGWKTLPLLNYQTGYEGLLGLPVEITFPHTRPELDPIPPHRVDWPYWVVNREDTEALVLFPATLGMLPVALACYITGDIKKSGGWLGFSAFFALLSSVLGWIAWGYAFTLTPKIKSVLGRYNSDPGAVWELDVEIGNVIWPGMVGAILVTIAAILIVIKVAIRPKKRDASGQQELDPTSEKVLGRSSSMPSKEPSSES